MSNYTTWPKGGQDITPVVDPNENHYLTMPKVIQFELSSNCNANCIGCSRADPLDDLRLNPAIEKNKFLSIDIFKKIVNAKRFEHATEIQFCGSIDDPPMHPQFLEMLEYLVANTKLHIIIHTNGSLRTPDYWAQMGKILQSHKHTVNFSIDGLSETNHIYRRGTNFEKIIENAVAYIEAGGLAQWQMVVFPWNAHQVEEAKEYSQSLGFSKFKERPDTCLDNMDLDKLHLRVKMEQTRSDWDWDRYVQSMSDQERHNGDIQCKSGRDELAYFIAHTGEMFPCCFLYNVRYQVIHFPEHTKRYEDAYGKNWNNAYYHDPDDIMSGPFFSNDLTVSWNNRNHGGKLPTDCNPICTNTCIKSRRGRWENKHVSTNLHTNEIVEVDNNKWIKYD